MEQKFPAPLADTYPPVVEIVGGDKITVAQGEPYIDEGVEAFDVDSEVTITTEGTVDTSTVGEYAIKYSIQDQSNNKIELTRTVKVIQPAGVVYLTFDDGPSEYTASLLDVLKKYNVKVTFFVTGRGDSSLIKREHEEGHTVALHTFTHDYSYVYRNDDAFFEDLTSIQNLVKEQTGETSMLMRFPGGSSNLVSRRYDGHTRIMSRLVNEITARGFTYFDWNVDSNDAGGASSADEVYNNVVSRLKWGESSVVLQHDVKGFSVEAVERIIQYCNDNNFLLKKLDASSFTAHHGINN